MALPRHVSLSYRSNSHKPQIPWLIHSIAPLCTHNFPEPTGEFNLPRSAELLGFRTSQTLDPSQQDSTAPPSRQVSYPADIPADDLLCLVAPWFQGGEGRSTPASHAKDPMDGFATPVCFLLRNPGSCAAKLSAGPAPPANRLSDIIIRLSDVPDSATDHVLSCILGTTAEEPRAQENSSICLAVSR